jgi:Protein of unknown function (DUF3891)
MIICPNPHPDYPNDWMLVKQSDHDDHCGFIAAHMNSPILWQPVDKRLLTIAVAIHDTGSASWEDRSIIDPGGKPWTYWTMPADDHIQLHRNGVRVACEVHPYAGLLVSMHVVGIHRDRLHIDPAPNRWHMPEQHTPRVEEFIAEQTSLQEQLYEDVETRLGRRLPNAQLMNDFKIFEVLDIMSTQFAACGLGDREMTYVPDRVGNPFTLTLTRAGEWEFRITPFLFDGDRFDCPLMARRMPQQVFKSDDEFREAWYASDQVKLPYAFVR